MRTLAQCPCCPNCGQRTAFTCAVILVAKWRWYPMTDIGHYHRQERAPEPNPVRIVCDCGQAGTRDENNGTVAWDSESSSHPDVPSQDSVPVDLLGQWSTIHWW